MPSRHTIQLPLLILGLALLLTTASTEAAENNFSCTEVSEIPQLECEALVDLYNSTDGPNWVQKEGWLTTTTPCSWYGVTCGSGSITELDLGKYLNGNGLSGALPATIENFTNLRHLDFTWNRLSSVPAEIGNLSSLTELGLSRNQLSSVPAELGNLSNLRTLFLSSNQLSSVPAELGNLSNLTWLDLWGNQLSSVPAELGNLSNLTILGLSSNQLSSVPAELGNLSNLTTLYLDSNQLSSVPAELGNLSNLTKLHLYSNQLSSVPAELGNLSNLRTLSLSSNQLSSVPAELGSLSNLTTLDLSYNRLTVTEPLLLSFLTTKDSDWQGTQTVAPANIEATALSDNSIQLTWDPIAFTEKGGSYEISIATAGSFVVHGTTPDKSSNSYIVTDLTPGTTYFFRIRTYTPAHDANPDWFWDDQRNELWSDYSTTVSAKTTGSTATHTPTVTPLPNTATPTPTFTSTPTQIPTFTPMPTVTPTPVQADRCTQAAEITPGDYPTDGRFERVFDVDWFTFDAKADTPYRIEVEIPIGSDADVNLELYAACGQGPTGKWIETFAPGVQMDFTSVATGPVYLRLTNTDDTIGGPALRYQLSVRQPNQETTTGAVIIVAGRLKPRDRLQDNIYHVTDEVFAIFQEQGYSAEDIYYLAPETTVTGYDAPATEANLEWAITNWAVQRVAAADVPDVLTLYMMDHGDIDRFYLDEPRDEILTPTQLDGWLDRLEATVPGIKINVIIEACHAGSFIQTPGSISGPNRLIITSSDEENDAYASPSGAYFSDQFLTALWEGDNLLSSWSRAKAVVEELFVVFPQMPWIDGDGDGIENELADFVEASRRGFAYAGTLSEEETLWPPYIAQATAPTSLTENGVQISAEVRDDRGVSHVWAVVYPPSYVPPRSDEDNELLEEDLEQIRLVNQGDDIYRGRAYNFTETGTYRIAIHADDDHGLLARPVVVEFSTGTVFERLQIFLPLIRQ